MTNERNVQTCSSCFSPALHLLQTSHFVCLVFLIIRTLNMFSCLKINSYQLFLSVTTVLQASPPEFALAWRNGDLLLLEGGAQFSQQLSFLLLKRFLCINHPLHVLLHILFLYSDPSSSCCGCTGFIFEVQMMAVPECWCSVWTFWLLFNVTEIKTLRVPSFLLDQSLARPYWQTYTRVLVAALTK